MIGVRCSLIALAVSVGGLFTPLSAATVNGAAREVASDIYHPNGNIYDQVLLEGTLASVRADAGQIVRISFVDLTDDIVQVQFSGAGTLTLTLEAESGPEVAANYRQPAVRYMKGHASLRIVDTDRNSHLSLFTVGWGTAGNRSVLRDDVTYDGVADVALLRIERESPGSATADFGGVWAGNTHFWSATGLTGIHAPQVQFMSEFRIGDISAFDQATPTLRLGNDYQSSDVQVCGGDLLQPNNRRIEVERPFSLWFSDGTRSSGLPIARAANQWEFFQRDDGQWELVVYPFPRVIIQTGDGVINETSASPTAGSTSTSVQSPSNRITPVEVILPPVWTPGG